MNLEAKIPNINIDDYNYYLPPEKIAQFPLEDRSQSKLLAANAATGGISHHKFYEIPELLPENSLLVLNTTRVIPARLKMQKPSGGKAELLCVDPIEPSTDPQIAMIANGCCKWKCIVGGKKIREGMVLTPEFKMNEKISNFEAKILKRYDNKAVVEFTWLPENTTFSSMIDAVGKTPLPPYIKRDAVESDKHRYQTIYAQNDGSVAAPTAGLHFTDNIMKKFKEKEISICEVTLHVGPGTFLPIEADNVTAHNMHREQIFISKNAIAAIRDHLQKNHRIIAAGTTSLRTIESLYWLGVKILFNYNDIRNKLHFEIGQWEPYELNEPLPSAADSLNSIIEWMDDKQLGTIAGRTQLFIIPGYRFQIANGLITNYHIPKSTLLLLVAAFLGAELWREVYSSALDNDYRFLSYGDASLLLR